jgi:hypothetical protein
MISRKSIVKAAHETVDAVHERSQSAFIKSLQALGDAFGTASPVECQEALMVLLPLVETLPLGRGAPIPGIVGTLAAAGTDPLKPLPSLVERAASAMESAKRFLEAYSRLGVEPAEDDAAAAIARLTRERDRLDLADEDAYHLAEAFHAGGDWVQPVLYLCQRKDARLALPQRERLTRAIEPMVGHVETAHWLYGLLFVLDDEPLVVLHRETGKGFRLRISGIGDNFQLHTLLAAHLIGEIPGQRLSVAEIKAATDGEIAPPGGIFGRFNLVDGSGKWIWNEGRPSDIPKMDGYRMVVLDPPPYQRSWNAGRAYPLMVPQLVIEERLSPEAAQALLSQAAPPDRMGGDDGNVVVTDDLTLAMPARGYDELVGFIIRGRLAGRDPVALTAEVAAEFGLSVEDADLALERTSGGLVRAATKNSANQPPRDKDPIAWESYQRGIADPSIIGPCTGIAG